MKSLNVTHWEALQTIPAEQIQWPDDLMNDPKQAPYFSGYFDDDFVIPGNDISGRWQKGAINPTHMIVGANSKDGTSAFYGIAPVLGLVPPDRPQTTASVIDKVLGLLLLSDDFRRTIMRLLRCGVRLPVPFASSIR